MTTIATATVCVYRSVACLLPTGPFAGAIRGSEHGSRVGVCTTTVDTGAMHVYRLRSRPGPVYWNTPSAHQWHPPPAACRLCAGQSWQQAGWPPSCSASWGSPCLGASPACRGHSASQKCGAAPFHENTTRSAIQTDPGTDIRELGSVPFIENS